MNAISSTVLYFTNSVARGGVKEHILALLWKLDSKIFRPVLVCPPKYVEKFHRDLSDDLSTDRKVVPDRSSLLEQLVGIPENR